jgi:hypothetical protein
VYVVIVNRLDYIEWDYLLLASCLFCTDLRTKSFKSVRSSHSLSFLISCEHFPALVSFARIEKCECLDRHNLFIFHSFYECSERIKRKSRCFLDKETLGSSYAVSFTKVLQPVISKIADLRSFIVLHYNYRKHFHHTC